MIVSELGDNIFVSFPPTSHTFKMSATFPNRVYYYLGDWNRDYYELPRGRWKIVWEGLFTNHIQRVVVFKKIEYANKAHRVPA